jgi:hypothetical protein
MRTFNDRFSSPTKPHSAFGNTQLYFDGRGDGQPQQPIDINKNVTR